MGRLVPHVSSPVVFRSGGERRSNAGATARNVRAKIARIPFFEISRA
jgi:hypothetical protein